MVAMGTGHGARVPLLEEEGFKAGFFSPPRRLTLKPASCLRPPRHHLTGDTRSFGRRGFARLLQHFSHFDMNASTTFRGKSDIDSIENGGEPERESSARYVQEYPRHFM